MKIISKRFLLFAIFVLLLVACGSEASPSLAVADQPTLVFIYTDG
jgi:hypothetical protein